MGYVLIAVQLFSGQLWLLAGGQFVFVWAILFFLFSTLPTAVAAWTEPDPESEIKEENRRELERGGA